MTFTPSHHRAVLAALAAVLLGSPLARAADAPASPDLSAELSALKARIAELEAQQGANWLSAERTGQIRAIVEDVLKDAKTRGPLAGGLDAGYSPGNGFYLQSPDQAYKLNISGYLQARYEFGQVNATKGRTLPGRTVGSGANATIVTPDDPADASGFSVRKARVAFAGNVFTPDLTFKLEGDFYGGAGGAFTVTDAFAAYRWTDLLRVRAGSYKVPFAKAELTSDTLVTTEERAEVMQPFDPVRALGVSLYGDLIKDQLSYEISANDGGNTNTLRRPDTTGPTANVDNRLAFYGRVQWAGSGTIADFAEEADRRTDNRSFIWLVGGAAGYESQNATNTAFPSAQASTTVTGLSNSAGPGFTNYTLNGDLYRATVDWSAKYQGWSLLAAVFFQQVNANPGNTSSTSGSTITTGPYGAGKSSFFQGAVYGQAGYFVVPRKLELIARAGVLMTEGYSNTGEFYTLGANYYLYGQNLKIQFDVTYAPEAPFTDAASGMLQNTRDIVSRVQVQLKF